jgi:hypothetical protein
MCVNGPDLVRVKELARHCNAPTPSHYNSAFKFLKRIYNRRTAVLRFQRGSAGRELVPSNSRSDALILSLSADVSVLPPIAFSSVPAPEPTSAVLTDMQRHFDIVEPPLPVNFRFSIMGYTDAFFAVGDTKNSISGFVIFVNCTPLMWGSMKQTTTADSTCSAEFVAASICCKQLMHVENTFRFFWLCLPEAVPTLHGFSSELGYRNQPNAHGTCSPYCYSISSCVFHGTQS